MLVCSYNVGCLYAVLRCTEDPLCLRKVHGARSVRSNPGTVRRKSWLTRTFEKFCFRRWDFEFVHTEDVT